jgi:putative nucleotidyltransferase with HDIG domain
MSIRKDTPGPFTSRVHPDWPVPSDEDCFDWWDRYAMPDNIRRHSLLVARIATAIARIGKDAGMSVDVPTVRASALLHDIAKGYAIHYGGQHAQLGAAWVTELTRNPLIAQGILHHVYWPFEIDVRRFFMPLAVCYADKRVQHDEFVSVHDRFDDLVARYGNTKDFQRKIERTRDQTVDLETALNDVLSVDLDAYPLDGGRLV